MTLTGRPPPVSGCRAASVLSPRCPTASMHPNTQPPPQVTLEPYERDHAVVVGVYRSGKKKGAEQ